MNMMESHLRRAHPKALPPSVNRDLEFAEKLYEYRRQRERTFPDGLFSDPAWDILLDLFISEGRNRRVSVGDACLASCVPPSTAMRWLTTLEDEGLIVKSSDTADRRRSFFTLSPQGLEKMHSYLLLVGSAYNPR